MAESSTQFCDQCTKHNQESILATFWCKDCDQSFCEECNEVHKVTERVKTHHVTKIKERFGTNGYCLDQMCTNHSKPIDSFCPHHDELLCLKCIQSEHSKCGDLLRINDAVNGIKTSTALLDIDEYVFSILQNIEKALEESSKSKEFLNVRAESIKFKINDTRQKINKALDEIQAKLLNELETNYNMAVSELDKVQVQLKEHEKKIVRTKTQLKQLKSHTSDIQTFVGIKTVGKYLDKEHDIVEHIIKNAKIFTIKLSLNSNLQSLVDSLKDFGNISVDITSGFEFFEELNKNTEQAIIQAFDVSKLMLTKVQVIQIKISKKPLSICGCAILRNEMIVFTDSSTNRLVIHNINGEFEKELKLANSPMNITVVSDDTVAVSYKFKTTHFDIINLSSNTMEQRISVSKTNWHIGLSFYDEKFYAAIEREGVKEISLDGTVTNTILSNINNIRKLVVTNEKLFYTRSSDDKIYCCDLKGSPIWEFSDQRIYKEYYSPSLTVDGYGKVFVVSYDTFVVIGVSHNGQHCRTVLDDSDGLNRPNAIFYDQHGKRILVCNKEDGYASLFNVIQ